MCIRDRGTIEIGELMESTLKCVVDRRADLMSIDDEIGITSDGRRWKGSSSRIGRCISRRDNRLISRLKGTVAIATIFIKRSVDETIFEFLESIIPISLISERMVEDLRFPGITTSHDDVR